MKRTTQEKLKIIEYAAKSEAIPFGVMKISGIASNQLLEKIHSKEELTPKEDEAFSRVKNRVYAICQKSYELNVKFMIDAEETWIQDPIDGLVYKMMEQFNNEGPIVWNTY